MSKLVQCIFILFFLLSVSSNLMAQKNDDSVVVNQVLFELKKQAYTMLDFKKYLNLKPVLASERVLGALSRQLRLAETDEFLLLCLAYLEAQNLDLQLYSENDKSIKDPLLRRYALALQFLDMKERTLQNTDKYKPWLEILKRKYNFSAKTDFYRTAPANEPFK